MRYKLQFKNPEGSQYKWSNIGNIRTNQYGNQQVGLQIARIKECVLAAERDGKSWINLSMFEDPEAENKPKEQPPADVMGHSVSSPSFSAGELEDEVPF